MHWCIDSCVGLDDDDDDDCSCVFELNNKRV